MSREAVMSEVVKKITAQKYFIAKKELKKKIAGLVPEEYWFYDRSKSDKKMALAFKTRYEDQYCHLHRWIKMKRNFFNARKIIKLIRVKERNLLNGYKKATALKYERFYPLKFSCVTTKVAKMDSIFGLEILFPREEITAEFKRKNVLNSQSALEIVALRIILSDIAIIG